MNGVKQWQVISILIILTLTHKAHRSNMTLAELGKVMDSAMHSIAVCHEDKVCHTQCLPRASLSW